MRKICILGIGDKAIEDIHGLVVHRDECITTVDSRNIPTVNLVCDLDKPVWNPALKPNYYDLIIAEHIAEHMSDRIIFLKNCRRIGKKGSVLILEVPNWSHQSAHNTLEHKSTWGRCMFDDNYMTREWFKKINMEYRITIPFTWKSFYVTNRIGRYLDKTTNVVSALRFYLQIL